MNGFSINLEEAPAEMAALYAAGLSEAMQSHGLSGKKADEYALQNLFNAGWYKTADDKWEMMGPDVRAGVNLRPAIRQPDGTFVIRDVDVFHENDVKGHPVTGEPVRYSAGDVRERIKNTNQAIKSGGQPPALSKGHPHQLMKMTGHVPASFGEAINWRVSPRSNGMARVDLVKVPEEMMEEWRKGKLTGLSAGLLHDSKGRNRRFGHVAALGAESQALATLPRVQVFQGQEQDLLHFSASPEAFEGEMPADDEEDFSPPSMFENDSDTSERKTPMKMSEMFAAIATAAAEAEAGKNPKALNEAFSSLAEEDFDMSSQAPRETMHLPEEPELKKTDGKGMIANKTELPSTGDVGFTTKAEADARFSALEAENAKLRAAMNGFVGRQAASTFSAFLKDAETAGHVFDADYSMELFTEYASAGNRAGIEKLKASILKAPKHPALGVGQVFNANGDSGQLPTTESILSRFEAVGGTFSAEDQAMGAALLPSVTSLFNSR